jgi:hypothetical protein
MITIPNGTVLPAGTRFTKIWRIKNTGECTWDDNFRFVYAGGDAFSAKLNNPLPHRVRKGQTVDMALEMIAPPIAGEFVSRWGLFDERIDFLFGHGDEEAFPVRIQTTTNTSGTIFNFVNNLCTAQWVNGSDAQLLCNRETRRNGYAVRKNISPDYDPDNKFNALVTHTQVSEGGSITGKYPYIPVPPNARLIGEIGCTSGNQDCDITMRIYYQVYGRPLELLNEWHEVYDDQATQFDFNLDGLRNQSVAFYLYVEANAAPGDAAGYWHALRLEAP